MTTACTWWSLVDTAGPAYLDQRVRSGVLSPAALRTLLEPFLAQRSAKQQAALLSLAILWHDDLDAAHKICQEHEGHQDCDYVHALMHRREPDYANAKYWFRAVGRHPAYEALAALPAVQAADPPLVKGGLWQPNAMVDACQAAVQTTVNASQDKNLRAIQAHEFAIFAHHLSQQ